MEYPRIQSPESEANIELQEEQVEIQKKTAEQNIKNQKIQNNKPQQNQTPKAAGRPNGTTKIPVQASKDYATKNIQQVIYAIEDLQSYAEDNFKKHKNIKNLNEQQKDLVINLCESVVCAKEKTQWKRSLLSCIKNFDKIPELISMEPILEIGVKNDLADYPSAILYHSKKI